MRHTTTVQRDVEYITHLTCDCCKQDVWGSQDIDNMIVMDLSRGYGSLFGDGTVVSVDLCETCFKARLGDLLRVEESPWLDALCRTDEDGDD